MKETLYEEVLVDFGSEWKVPVKNRTSTDKPFMVCFVAFITLWTIVGCYAVVSGDINDYLTDENTGQFLYVAIGASRMIFGLIAASAVLSLIYAVLLRWFALPLMIISATFLTTFYTFVAYYFYSRYSDKVTNEDGTTNNDSNRSGYFTLMVIFTILAVIIPIVVLCLLKKIKLACQLIQEASKAVMCIYSSMLFPVLKAILHFLIIIQFIDIAAHLSSIKNLDSTVYKLLLTILLAGSVWLYCFITALGEIILASAFATWYWTFDKRKVPSFTIVEGARRTFRYHLGTVAFGSLLLTICRVIRIFLECLKSNGRFGIVFLICARFFMRYLESFLKYMNRNAYIMCALYGKGLHTSATIAMDLIFRHALRTIALTNIVSWVFYTAEILITTAMGSLAFWYYQDSMMVYWWVPVWLIVIGTYLVTRVFFSVYIIAIDTIYICFLEDCEHHDGTILKPYYMSLKLRSLLYKEESQ